MDIAPEEIDQRLARAAQARRTLRRATRKLMALGATLLAARPDPSSPDDAGSG